MYIESLDLKNFRNYEELHLTFDRGINVFFGDNAQGKTNILEALYVCATSRSHRGSKDREMIRFGQEEAHLRMEIRKQDIPGRIDMHFHPGKSRGIAIGGIPIRKASELFGVIHVVCFSPEDLGIVKNGPAERRQFLNMELCQLDRGYVSDLLTYNKVLQQRNQLLKDLYFRPDLEDTLDVWDEQLIKSGREIIKKRRKFVKELNTIIRDIHLGLSGGREELFLTYEPDIEEEDFRDELIRNRETDKKMKTTVTGPHRDDVGFGVNDINIRKYGSQGQQRSAALSLKLSEIELVKKRTGDSPVLLLDDVLSELDSGRQENLLSVLSGIQAFITCTGLDDFVSHSFHIDRLFQVNSGKVN